MMNIRLALALFLVASVSGCTQTSSESNLDNVRTLWTSGIELPLEWFDHDRFEIKGKISSASVENNLPLHYAGRGLIAIPKEFWKSFLQRPGDWQVRRGLPIPTSPTLFLHWDAETEVVSFKASFNSNEPDPEYPLVARSVIPQEGGGVGGERVPDEQRWFLFDPLVSAHSTIGLGFAGIFSNDTGYFRPLGDPIAGPTAEIEAWLCVLECEDGDYKIWFQNDF